MKRQDVKAILASPRQRAEVLAGAGQFLLDLGADGTHAVHPQSAANCAHTHEQRTETVWPGTPADDVRMTWTCEACGRVRGRA